MSEDPGKQPVRVERRERVLVITLNRPEARNAVNLAVAEEVGAALDQLDGDPDLLVGVLTGAPPDFCAGMDLKAFAAGERPWIPGRGFAGIVEYGSRKPLIAAVEGFALAGGFEVALACDLIVAAEDAQFAIPEVKRGLFAAAGGLIRLPRSLPHHAAAEMALTGDPLAARRLYELGLLNRLTPPGRALDTALELATAIVPNSPLSVRTSKSALNEERDWTSEEAWQQMSARLAEILAAPDAHEGATAFAEKRPPQWQTY